MNIKYDRTCWVCKTNFPTNNKYFYKNKSDPHGLGYICKPCAKNNRKNTHILNKKHGRSAYYSAKQRCTNPKGFGYKYYGGRGIEFRFKSFDEFKECLGPRPAGMTLDRINSDGHYEPGNVRWVNWEVQNRNKKSVFLNMETAEAIRILYKTKQFTQTSLAKMFKISNVLIAKIVSNKNWKSGFKAEWVKECEHEWAKYGADFREYTNEKCIKCGVKK